MRFLPEDYKAPVTAGGYMSLQNGENKIRVLSQPIVGWEDWIDNKPMRYTMDLRPEKSYDSKKPFRHFWAFIVWNYREEKVQILQITSSAIRKTIQDLCDNEDWGAPYFYDIVIKKEGEQINTKYSATPIPPKPISEHVKQAFYEKPIYLEALFNGEDPFSVWPKYTNACFLDKPEDKFINENEANELRLLFEQSSDEDQIKIKALIDKSGIKHNFSNVPKDKYDAVYKYVYAKYLKNNADENSLIED